MATAAETIIALLMKPLKSGTPDIENAPTMYRRTTSFMRPAMPPRSVNLRNPVVYNTAPVPMNSRDL